MNSFADFLSQFASWCGQVWRGEAYQLLSRQLLHEREQATKREMEQKERIAALEKHINALQDRILQIKGVQPINTKIQPKPSTQRLNPVQAGINKAYLDKYGSSQEAMLAMAREWKAKNSNGNAATLQEVAAKEFSAGDDDIADSYDDVDEDLT